MATSSLDERFKGLLEKPKGQNHGYDQSSWEVYNKNKDVFTKLRDYIKIPWGDIPEDKIIVKKDMKGIRGAVNMHEDEIFVAKKGVTIFTDERGMISIAFANDGDTSKVIYLHDYDTNKDIYDPQEIKKDIDRRYLAAAEIGKTFDSINLPFNSLPEMSKSLGKPRFEICVLSHLFQGLLYLNGAPSRPYASQVVYKGKNSPNLKLVDSIMKSIYGSDTKRKNEKAFGISVPINGEIIKTTVNLGSDNSNIRSIFVATAYVALRKKTHFNVFSVMSDEYLKVMLKGVSYDKASEIDSINDRKELVDLAYSLRDVDIDHTLMKAQSYSKNLQNSDAPSRTLLLFPDKMYNMYYFNVDVNSLKNSYSDTLVDRFPQGYERRRGEKEPEDIVAKRKAVANANIDTSNSGNNKKTYVEYNKETSVEDFGKLVDKLIGKNGILTEAVIRNVIEDIDSQNYNDSETAKSNVMALLGALDYADKILHSKHSEELEQYISSAFGSLLGNVQDIYDLVNGKGSTKRYIVYHVEPILSFIMDCFDYNKNLENVSLSLLKKKLIERSLNIFSSKKTSEKTAERAAETAERNNSEKMETFEIFDNDIVNIRIKISDFIKVIKNIDFGKIDSDIISRLGIGQTGLVTSVTDILQRMVDAGKTIEKNSYVDGKFTDVFNWISTLSDDVHRVLVDMDTIIELAKKTNVTDVKLLKRVMVFKDMCYNVYDDMSEYYNTSANAKKQHNMFG